MSISTILQFSALGVAALIGVCAISSILEMRRSYAAQQVLLQRIDANLETLQKAVSEIQPAFEELRRQISAQTTTQADADQRKLALKQHQARFRRQTLRDDSKLRFTVLQEWLSVNTLAVLRRASQPWHTAQDLIATVPDYLEPEAEVVGGCVLLIGTREHDERLAVPFRTMSKTSDYFQWFDISVNGHRKACSPAVVTRDKDRFEVVSKGTTVETVLA